MHRPWPDSFQSFHYPEEPFRASPVESHRHPHHHSAPEHSESGLLEHVFNISNPVIVLFRCSYPEKEQKSSQKIIGLESNQALATRFQCAEHSLQGLNWFLKEMEGSYTQSVIERASETQRGPVHLNNRRRMIRSFKRCPQHLPGKVHSRIFCFSL